MTPRIRVLAGTSADTMVPITPIVNTGRTHRMASGVFEGEVVAYIKGFTDENGKLRDSEYFERKDRQGITWSIQVQGRFLVPYSADDILFGNTFDRPLKLPWGTSAVLKFMNYIDPTLEHELDSKTKPWALSPLIATMPHFMHTRIPLAPILSSPGAPGDVLRSRDFSSQANGVRRPQQPRLNLSLPKFPLSHSIEDDTSQLYLASTAISSPGSESGASSSGSDASSVESAVSRHSSKSSGSQSSKTGSLRSAVKKIGRRKNRGNDDMKFESASQRRSFFSDVKNRQGVEFGPMDVITTDFCYGFMNFSPSLSLQLPGGVSFDLMKYWDGQPVRFVCCERKDPNSSGGDPWGRIFWCVSIEMVDDEEDEDVD